MAGSSSCTTRSSVARRRRPAPRSSSNHAARRAATAARVASVALGRCRSACHGWPPTRTLAVDRSPPIPGGARRRPRFGCMKHEPGGRFHVAATEDLITEQRQRLRSTNCYPKVSSTHASVIFTFLVGGALQSTGRWGISLLQPGRNLPDCRALSLSLARGGRRSILQGFSAL